MTHALATRADNPDHPYGDVTYADPGYQKDGKARYPLDSEEHCRAAWSYIHQADNAALYTAKQLRKIEDRIRTAGKEYGVDFTDEETDEPSGPEEDDPMPMGRRSSPGGGLEWGYSLLRSYALEDIEIQRGGDGRTVTAYAAMFDTPYEVRDQHGHYMEEIERSAFNRTLSHGTALRSAVCLYNHGFTASGAPDMLGSVPLGTPMDIRAEAKGLLTITRYNKTPLADSVLEAIRAGNIRSQSFRGRIYRSSPDRVPRSKPGTPLPTVVRHELGLSDYGPTPFAVNAAAEIVAVRSRAQLAAELDHLDPNVRADLIRRYVPTPHDEDPADDHATPIPGLGAEDSPSQALRSAADIARRIRVEQIRRGIGSGPSAGS